MLVHRAVVTPSSERPRGPRFRPFGRPLALHQFLKIDPLPLRLRQQSRTCLCPKVANDDTSKVCSQTSNAEIRLSASSPNEHGEDDDGTEQVVDEEKDGVDLRRVRLRLLIGARYARRDAHDVDPALERDNLKEYEQGCVERIKGERCRRGRIRPHARDGECKGGATVAIGHNIVIVLVDAGRQARHVRVVARICQARKDVQAPHGVGDHVEHGEEGCIENTQDT